MVATIAGNGAPGMTDGPSSGAAFLLPVAVAASNDGSLLVVDQAAQRVRRVDHGWVSTFAGSGEDVGSFGKVIGGYLDGPARQAKFNEPTSIAVARDGAVYVADQMNHCIRKIERGEVSTWAGHQDQPGANDGSLTSASFKRPMSIVLSADGDMFVADFGVGLREITHDGVVRTIGLPTPGRNRFTGVAVAGSGDGTTVVAVEDNGLFFSVLPEVASSGRAFNGAEGNVLPRLHAIAAVNGQAFVGTDLKLNAIRQLRLPDPPLVTQPSTALLAGAPVGDPQDSGGFLDGKVDKAQFYSPLGIAVVGHRIIICDSGNRRLRAMPLPDMRGPLGSNIVPFDPQPKTYKILLFGSSGTFWATTWDSSIPGLLEHGLLQDRAKIGLAKPPQVFLARLDQANFLAQLDYASTFASGGQFKLVVMLLETDSLNTIDAVSSQARFDVAVQALKGLKSKLAETHTELFVNVRPNVFSASQIDDVYDRDANAIAPPTATFYQSLKTQYVSTLSAAGVAYAVDMDDYTNYNIQPNHAPLWSFEDSHENARGRQFAAADLLRSIEQLRPWGKPAHARPL